MVNWILAKLDKHKIKIIKPKFIPDEASRDWAV